ncbi:hypothetical protein ACFWIY_22620 [Streptomyces sioyaensis]|uniref:hypothetical protein n=1 Tax=Streptomyces sioyaensis TaxID=67364 RepID=UPI003648744F
MAAAAASPTREIPGAVQAGGTVAVSLGDSFISGEGGRWQGNAPIKETVGTDMWGTDRARVDCSGGSCKKDPYSVYGVSYQDPDTGKFNGCHRSDVAEIKSAALGVDRQVNYACSGAVTGDVLPDSAGGRWFKGEHPQTDQLRDLARQWNVKLVQLSVSGNDLGFSSIIKSCITQYIKGPTGSYCSKSWDAKVKEQLAGEVPRKVKATVEQIRKTMREEGYGEGDYVFALQSYPAPIPKSDSYRFSQSYLGVGSDRYRIGGCPFWDKDTDWARSEVVPGIATMLRQVARDERIGYLDLQDAFNGHGVCDKAARQPTKDNALNNPVPARDAEWMRFLSWGLADPQGQEEESFHPNSYGQKALGKCLSEFYSQAQGSQQPMFTCLNTAGQGEEGMHLRALG